MFCKCCVRISPQQVPCSKNDNSPAVNVGIAPGIVILNSTKPLEQSVGAFQVALFTPEDMEAPVVEFVYVAESSSQLASPSRSKAVPSLVAISVTVRASAEVKLIAISPAKKKVLIYSISTSD